MPDLTPAHRDHARRALVAAGYPITDDVDGLERIRRTELLEAVATVDALAEARGQRTPPSDVLRDRLAAAWDEGYVAAAGDPDHPGAANPYAVEPDVGGLLDTDEPQPDEDLCTHPDGYGDPDPIDGLRRCRSGCSDVAVGGLEVRDGVVVQGNARVAALQRLAGDEDTTAERRADRMTWTPGDLQITPPKACGAMPPADETLRAFEDLFAGGPDTVCRTIYPDGVECIVVPMDELRSAFAEACAALAAVPPADETLRERAAASRRVDSLVDDNMLCRTCEDHVIEALRPSGGSR